MEYVIVLFVGLWIVAAGIIAYMRISADFSDIDIKQKMNRMDDNK